MSADLARELERLFAALVREGARLGYTEAIALTPTQHAALAVLVDDGPLRLGVLADAMGTTDATATRTVQALERHGLVGRAADAADGRGVVIGATPAGRALVERKRRRLTRIVARLVPEEDRERLAALLRDLTGAVAR